VPPLSWKDLVIARLVSCNERKKEASDKLQLRLDGHSGEQTYIRSVLVDGLEQLVERSVAVRLFLFFLLDLSLLHLAPIDCTGFACIRGLGNGCSSVIDPSISRSNYTFATR